MSASALIIEDNEQNMYLMSFLLESGGFSVDKAANGEEGLQMALAKSYDVILLDINLPCLDGHEVARRLRLSESTGTIPIVAVTSCAMVGDREKIISAGCNGYIEKPIDPDCFVSSIRSFIN